MVGTRRVPFRPLLSLVAALAAVSPYGGAQGCASSPQGDGPGGTAARSEDAVGAADTAGTGQTGSTGTAETGAPAPAVERVYAGFLPGTFATEPVALLPPVRIELPPEFEGGPAGQDLVPELERILLDRLPEELRILHSRAPVHAFGRWPGRDVVPAGPLEEILGWSGLPGPAGELPEAVGNAVETVGDDRGIRWFLFPRTLTVRARGPFHHAAYVEAYLLDARGERVVWAGTGFAEGRLPERDPERLLRAVVLDAARRAAADLARRVPGSNAAGGDAGFSDVDAGATREVR